MAGADLRVLVTCEHGGYQVPRGYQSLFRGQDALLRSHRGWDPGALPLARRLASGLDAPLIAARTTRLLVDLNRSAHNPRVFSELTRGLPRDVRDALLARHHRPHWDRVRRALADYDGPTLHLAVHSFTPVWRGKRRPFTVGLLYDPQCPRETSVARGWQERLASALAPSRIRRNAPYRGDADGLTTAMRREHAERRYLGLELELNQASLADASERRRLGAVLLATFREARQGLARP